MMKKIRYIKCLMVLLFFCSTILTNNKDSDFKTKHLSHKNIEKKYKQFKEETNKAKKFKTATTCIATGAGIAITAYMIKKIVEWYKPNTSTNKKKLDSETIESLNKNDLEKKILNKLLDKPSAKSSFKDFIRYGAGKGLSFGIAGVVATPLLFLQSDFLKITKEKFSKLWNGKNPESLVKLTKMLYSITDEIKGFLGEDKFYKDELVEFYSIFIEILEDFIALSKELADSHIKKESNIRFALKGMQNLLYKKTNSFSNILEKELNKNNLKFLVQEKNNVLILEFGELEKQIKRFTQLLVTIVYENKNNN